MPRKNEPKNLAAFRREHVAWCALKGLSVRAIAEAISKPGISFSGEEIPALLNPNSGKPFSKSVISNDLNAMRLEWRQSRDKHIDEHQSELLAKYKEVERQAWADGDLDLVLRSLDRIAKLIGANAPVRREISGPGGAPLEVSAISEEAAQELLDKFRSESPEEIIDITPISTRSAALGLTLSEEPKNGNGGGNGGGHNGN